MPNLNSVQLMGNVTREIDVRYTPKGTAVAELGLAVNRVTSNDQGEKREITTFVDVTCWGRTAEIAGEYLRKGSPVFIQGRLDLQQWDDKTTGEKRSKLKVVCENLQLLGGKRDDAEGERTERPPAQRTPARTAPKAPARPPADPDLDVEDESIPF